jgi:hypothetical protein
MAIPTQYTSRITVPLPSEEGVRKVIGDTYDPEKVLNVFKMFAGTGRYVLRACRACARFFGPKGSARRYEK